jgi:hypothetical protein
MLKDAMGTHMTHRSAIVAEAVGAGRNFVSSCDLNYMGGYKTTQKSVPVVPGKSSIYP